MYYIRNIRGGIFQTAGDQEFTKSEKTELYPKD
jgi:hypothetical protein